MTAGLISGGGPAQVHSSQLDSRLMASLSLWPSGQNKLLCDQVQNTNRWAERSTLLSWKQGAWSTFFCPLSLPLLRQSAPGCTFPERVERFVFVSEVRLPSNIQSSQTETLWLLHLLFLLLSLQVVDSLRGVRVWVFVLQLPLRFTNNKTKTGPNLCVLPVRSQQ